MAGLDNNMLSVIECLAKNKIQDAKNAAIVCCKNDTTKKNAANLNYYQKLLENGNSTFMELPPNLQAYMSLEDVSGFREDQMCIRDRFSSVLLFDILRRSLFDIMPVSYTHLERNVPIRFRLRNGRRIHHPRCFKRSVSEPFRLLESDSFISFPLFNLVTATVFSKFILNNSRVMLSIGF